MYQDKTSADAFSSLHPAVNFFFFGLVIIFTMLFQHPISLLCSLIAGLSYAIFLVGRRALVFFLKFLLPLALLAGLINPLFNHEGKTIIGYFPGGNPLTLEAILYGIFAAVMLAAVVSWFYCYQAVMTSDKTLMLLGRMIPALSLILTMALRFIPHFAEHFRTVRAARKTLGQRLPEGRFGSLREGARTLGGLLVWASENAIETADSMRNRGYGQAERTHYIPVRLTGRDKRMLAAQGGMAGLLIAGAVGGGFGWYYYPGFGSPGNGPITAVTLGAFALLCLFPLFVNGEEAWRWRSSASDS